VLVDNPFDLVDGLRAVFHQVLPEIGELSDLGIGRIGGENATNTIGTLPSLESLTVVPKEFAEGIGITFVGLVHGGIFGLNDNDFGASGLLEFFEEPVVEAADFDDCHVATMFACLLGKVGEKVVNVGVIGTDLSFLHDISLFVSDIDGQLVLVLVDSKVQHDGYSMGLKVSFEKYTLPYENPLCISTLR